jgi:hypothetical protein
MRECSFILTLTYTSMVYAVGGLVPLEPVAETGSYAGQALDVLGNTAVVGHKIDDGYALRFYDHTPEGWSAAEVVEIGSRRGISVAFGVDFLGVALSGNGNAGVVLEPHLILVG